MRNLQDSVPDLRKYALVIEATFIQMQGWKPAASLEMLEENEAMKI